MILKGDYLVWLSCLFKRDRAIQNFSQVYWAA